ncbi:MAG TPA: hypothetical protein VM659_00135, partial [Dongiaceae bacterium]|nr:hypothetical protein [Dongiaceae bacterium]
SSVAISAIGAASKACLTSIFSLHQAVVGQRDWPAREGGISRLIDMARSPAFVEPLSGPVSAGLLCRKQSGPGRGWHHPV